MATNKLKQIQLLLLDVDGVLTDGSIIYNDKNEETKVFNVKDGLGIRLLMDSGIKVGIVTGRSSGALNHRCKNLGITMIFHGIQDKVKVLDEILKTDNITSDEIAFAGDDLPDLPLMKKVGLSIAVNDAHEVVQHHADMITFNKSGAGAVREISEAILKAKGIWQKIVDYYI